MLEGQGKGKRGTKRGKKQEKMQKAGQDNLYPRCLLCRYCIALFEFLDYFPDNPTCLECQTWEKKER